MLVKRRALFTRMNTPRFPFHHLERCKGIKPDPRTFVARLWLWKCALMFGDKLQAENSDAKSTQSHAEDNAQAPCLNNKRLLHHGRLTSSCLKTPAKTAVLCKLLVWAKMASSQGNMWQTWCIIFSLLCVPELSVNPPRIIPKCLHKTPRMSSTSYCRDQLKPVTGYTSQVNTPKLSLRTWVII